MVSTPPRSPQKRQNGPTALTVDCGEPYSSIHSTVSCWSTVGSILESGKRRSTQRESASGLRHRCGKECADSRLLDSFCKCRNSCMHSCHLSGEKRVWRLA